MKSVTHFVFRNLISSNIFSSELFSSTLDIVDDHNNQVYNNRIFQVDF